MELEWLHQGKVITTVDDMPEGVYGFIYRIDNLTKNKFYIGEKQLLHLTNPEISKKMYDGLKAEGLPVTRTKNTAKSKPGEVVWRYKRKNVMTETNWLTYTGSSDELNADIKNGDKIKRSILKFTFSKKEHTTREVIEIIKHDCLESCDCYNKQILGSLYQIVKC